MSCSSPVLRVWCLGTTILCRVDACCSRELQQLSIVYAIMRRKAEPPRAALALSEPALCSLRMPCPPLIAAGGLLRRSDDKKDGKTRKTGVSFDDVAGIDEVKADIEEVLTMMMGDQKYAGMGAKMPRGILLEGPPGTGKTYLAKAMAGEAGIPFFSANGAEFVEMFQGVAAARVRNLFKTARANAPAIVFIDEIDAIGKARGDGGGDSGSAEREHGLLQLLQEMDGFTRLDKVPPPPPHPRATIPPVQPFLSSVYLMLTGNPISRPSGTGARHRRHQPCGLARRRAAPPRTL